MLQEILDEIRLLRIRSDEKKAYVEAKELKRQERIAKLKAKPATVNGWAI